MFKKIIILLLMIGGVVYFFYYQQAPTDAYRMIISEKLDENKGGLYEDNVTTGYEKDFPYASKYYFRGDEAENYFWHDNFCFNIVHLTVNHKLKVVLNGFSENKQCIDITQINEPIIFSEENNNDWLTSNIVATFDIWLEEGRIFDKSFDYNNDIFVEGEWYYGKVDSRKNLSGNIPNTLANNIVEERNESIYESKIGLVSQSEYLKSLEGLQVTYASNDIPRETFLFNEWNFWTLTGHLHDQERVYAITAAQELEEFTVSSNSLLRLLYADSNNYTIFPAFYIDGLLEFEGNGTSEEPFYVK